MRRRKVLTFLFIVWSVHIKILCGVQIPFLSVQVKEPLLVTFPVTCTILISYLPLWEKRWQHCYYRRCCAFQNLCLYFVLKQNRLPCCCNFIIPLFTAGSIITHDSTSSFTWPMNTGFQWSSQRLLLSSTDNDHKCTCTQSVQGNETNNLFPGHVRFIISNFVAYNVEQYIFQLFLSRLHTIMAFLECDLFQCWPHSLLPHVAKEKDKGGIHGQGE